MDKMIAHNEKDAQKRRATWEEKYLFFQGHHYSIEEIRKRINPPIEVTGHFFNSPQNPYRPFNPVICFENSVFSFSEQGLREALSKLGANMKDLKMTVGKEKGPLYLDSCFLPPPIRFEYGGRDDIFSQECVITYKGIQMTICRMHIKGVPFGIYRVLPVKEMPCESHLTLKEDEFYLLDLPTLLLDLSFEYELRQEELKFYMKQMRINTIETLVLDEDHIALDDIDPANIQSWMDRIRDYFMRMTEKYQDQVFIYNLGLKPKSPGKFVRCYGGPTKDGFRMGHAPLEKFLKSCREEEIEMDLSASSPVYLKAPIGYMTTATFKVGDEEMVIEERVFPKAPIKDTIAIFPYAKDRSFQITIQGYIGMHAIIGYLKQMPELSQKMKKLSESLNF